MFVSHLSSLLWGDASELALGLTQPGWPRVSWLLASRESFVVTAAGKLRSAPPPPPSSSSPRGIQIQIQVLLLRSSISSASPFPNPPPFPHWFTSVHLLARSAGRLRGAAARCLAERWAGGSSIPSSSLGPGDSRLRSFLFFLPLRRADSRFVSCSAALPR